MEEAGKPSLVKVSEGNESIVTSWFLWHFVEMPKFLFLVWKNYLAFGSNFFSIPLLFSTLFSPWRRYKWHYPKGFDIWGYYTTFISNVFSRITGAICRFFLIIFGVVTQIFIFTLGIIVILFWILMPFISVALIVLL